MSNVIIMFLFVLVFLLIAVLIYLLRSWKAERTEYVKMIAAKNYTEYSAVERNDSSQQSRHKNLITEQRKKIHSRKNE